MTVNTYDPDDDDEDDTDDGFAPEDYGQIADAVEDAEAQRWLDTADLMGCLTS